MFCRVLSSSRCSSAGGTSGRNGPVGAGAGDLEGGAETGCDAEPGGDAGFACGAGLAVVAGDVDGFFTAASWVTQPDSTSRAEAPNKIRFVTRTCYAPGGATGSVSVITVPRPTSDSTSIRPSCIWTIR